GVQTCALPISPKNEPSVKKTGGNTSHAVNNDPVAISILFVIAGTVMPTRPLTLIKAVKLTAASRPQNTPVAERPSSEAPNTSAPSNEPTNKITAEIHFSTVGKRRSNSHSANKPIQENWNNMIMAMEASKYSNDL